MTLLFSCARIIGVKANTATILLIHEISLNYCLVQSKDAYSNILEHEKPEVVGSTPTFIFDEVAQMVEHVYTASCS